MPGMDGWETLSKIKERKEWRHIPVAMFTIRPPTVDTLAREDIEDIVDYITKPFTKQELITRIEQILDRSREINEKRNMIVEKLGVEVADKFERWVYARMLHKNLAGIVRSLVESGCAGGEAETKKLLDLVKKEEGLVREYDRRIDEVLSQLAGVAPSKPPSFGADTRLEVMAESIAIYIMIAEKYALLGQHDSVLRYMDLALKTLAPRVEGKIPEEFLLVRKQIEMMMGRTAEPSWVRDIVKIEPLGRDHVSILLRDGRKLRAKRSSSEPDPKLFRYYLEQPSELFLQTIKGFDKPFTPETLDLLFGVGERACPICKIAFAMGLVAIELKKIEKGADYDAMPSRLYYLPADLRRRIREVLDGASS